VASLNLIRWLKMLKDGGRMGATRKNITSNNRIECILDVLKPAGVFLCGDKKAENWRSQARSSRRKSK